MRIIELSRGGSGIKHFERPSSLKNASFIIELFIIIRLFEREYDVLTMPKKLMSGPREKSSKTT